MILWYFSLRDLLFCFSHSLCKFSSIVGEIWHTREILTNKSRIYLSHQSVGTWEITAIHHWAHAMAVKRVCVIWAACHRWTWFRHQPAHQCRVDRRRRASSQAWVDCSAKRTRWKVEKTRCKTRRVLWVDCRWIWATLTRTTTRWA